ncbi:hypothetical protein KAR04_03440 [Candidatus Calescamantes bacterium]|nr:hypothetical protein [Candidatus Calescamantes bacterium]
MPSLSFTPEKDVMIDSYSSERDFFMYKNPAALKITIAAAGISKKARS